jgi:methylated-DNA-[protein]-cysteine S-methyltransferase
MYNSPAATPTDESTINDLRAAFSTSADADDAMSRRDALAESADGEGLLDLAYRTIETPIGPLLIAATDAGLVRVAFDCENHDSVLEQLAMTISPRVLRTTRRLDDVARQLDEYLTGKRQRFELTLDLRLASGFRRTVLTHLPEIRYGTTASYAALATVSGNPTAIRAAASACSHNPLPLVIPCHRIVKSDGSVGQYLGGVATKQSLLSMEREHAA